MISKTKVSHLYLLQLLQSLLQLLLQSFVFSAQLSVPLFVCVHYFFELLQDVFLPLHSLLQNLQKFGWITVALSCPENKMH